MKRWKKFEKLHVKRLSESINQSQSSSREDELDCDTLLMIFKECATVNWE